MSKLKYIISLIADTLDALTGYKDTFNEFVNDFFVAFFGFFLVKYDEKEDRLKFVYDNWVNYFIPVPLSAAPNVTAISGKLYYKDAPHSLAPVTPADDDSTLTYKQGGITNLKRGNIHVTPFENPLSYRYGRRYIFKNGAWKEHAKQGEVKVVGSTLFWRDNDEWKVWG